MNPNFRYTLAVNMTETLKLAISFLGKEVSLKFDQPIGSSYSKLHIEKYPVNYGYVPNTISGDGMELDAYFLGVDEPLMAAKGKCIAIIHRIDEEDDKLIVVPNGMTLTEQEIKKQTFFQEKWHTSVILKICSGVTIDEVYSS